MTIQDLEAELKHLKNMKESYEENNNEQVRGGAIGIKG